MSAPSDSPAYPTVLSLGAVQAAFGAFTWKPDGPSQVVIEEAWIEANLISVHVPELVGAPLDGGGHFSGNVRWHRRGAEQLRRAWAEVGKAGLLGLVRTWDGSWNPRRMRGSQALSRHAWGIAFDINAAWNGLGQVPAAVGKTGSVRELVPLFERHGFCWGGRWESRPDGMHVELARLLEYPATSSGFAGDGLRPATWQVRLPVGVFEAQEIAGRPFAPARAFLAALIQSPPGGELVWDAAGQRLTIRGRPIPGAIEREGAAWAPVRSLAEAMGYTLAVDAPSRSVRVQRAAPSP